MRARRALTGVLVVLAACLSCSACYRVPPYMRDAHRSPEAQARAAEGICRDLGAAFRVEVVDGLFFIATDMPAEEAKPFATVLSRITGALHPALFERMPAEPLRVYLFKDRAGFLRHARWRYWWLALAAGDGWMGCYRPGERKIAMRGDGGNGNLCHEFVHVLVHGDLEDPPAWLDEGLACLFEAGDLRQPGRFIPEDNHRLAFLQKTLREGRAIPLGRLLGMGTVGFHFPPSRIDVTYAESRYLCLYLEEKGRLQDFYRRFKSGCSEDPTGRRALEAVLGQDLEAFEPAWRSWVLAR